MKLTKPQQRIADKAKYVAIVETMEPDGTKTYRFLDGKNVRSDVFLKLISASILVPNNDALFSGFSQTYKAVKDV